jgi:hypothetical protein
MTEGSIEEDKDYRAGALGISTTWGVTLYSPWGDSENYAGVLGMPKIIGSECA